MAATSRPSSSNRSKAPTVALQWAKEQTATLPQFSKCGKMKPDHALDRDKWPNFIKQPANITMDGKINSQVLQGKSLASLDPNVWRLLQTPVIFMAPHIFFAHALGPDRKPACPVCKSSAGVTLKGWAPQLRRVCGFGCTYLLYSFRYACGERKDHPCPGKLCGCCCCCPCSVFLAAGMAAFLQHSWLQSVALLHPCLPR